MQNVLRMHRATDKMGMAVKRAMEQYPDAMEWSRETLLAKLNAAVEKQEWVDAQMFMGVLWFQEWCEFLGRDFTTDGNDPEHAHVEGSLAQKERRAPVERRDIKTSKVIRLALLVQAARNTRTKIAQAVRTTRETRVAAVAAGLLVGLAVEAYHLVTTYHLFGIFA